MARYIPSSEYPHFKLNYVISFPSKRAELKLQSLEEQARVAALNKEYQATYREKYKSQSSRFLTDLFVDIDRISAPERKKDGLST
jgi:hypothetical protein